MEDVKGKMEDVFKIPVFTCVLFIGTWDSICTLSNIARCNRSQKATN